MVAAAGFGFQIGRAKQVVLRIAELSLQIGDRLLHGRATPVQRSEEETKVNVKENDKAGRAERELLDLVLGQFEGCHFFGEREVAGEAPDFTASPCTTLKVTLSAYRATAMFVPATLTNVSKSSSVLNSTFTSV